MQLPHQPTVSVVIPVYNEAGVIGDSLSKLILLCKNSFHRFEIIVVSDGSTDGTDEVISAIASTEPTVRALILPHAGKGAAVKAGVLTAIMDVVCFLDCDLSIDPQYLVSFVAQLPKTDAVGIIASRFIDGGEANSSITRRCTSTGFRVLRTLTLGLSDVADTQCGCKAFQTKQIQPLAQKTQISGFCFDAELLYLCRKEKFTFLEMPVVIQKTPDFRQSKVGLLREILTMSRDLFRIKRLHG